MLDTDVLPLANDFAPELDALFNRHVDETSYEVTRIEGAIPDYVQGSLYLNGPARFHCHEVRYRNWLDGDGMVCALHFRGDRIELLQRFVQGRKFAREAERGEAIYRAFGTAFPGDRLKKGIGTESPYNVSVIHYRDKLLAFGEQSLPMELDPVTLSTLNPATVYDFDGALNEAAPFSAHPKTDARGGELLNFGIFFAPHEPLLIYYRFGRDGQLSCRSRTPSPYPCSIHDFAVSENYAVFYLCPYTLDVNRLASHRLSTIDCLA
jgi:all-trans-8'-apo-beta-carotenal 15,15'-oxygenase